MRTIRNLVLASAFLSFVLVSSLYAQRSFSNPEKIEEWRGKTILVFGAHPDDDLAPAGTMAKLAKNGNKVMIVLFTSGNKGSRDLEMTSERLAEIRKAEDIAANKALGIPEENIICLGYDDGMLEYVPEKELVEKVCRLIRKYRPDAVFGHDPGDKYVKWNKTDHRMAALVTLDGARAAAYHLYFPSQRIHEGLAPFTVTDFFFFGGGDPNFSVDITDVAEAKFKARTQHVSQWGKGNLKYTGPQMDPADVEAQRARSFRKDADGKIYERFRRVRESLSF
jgi:LmbE family N-acetylglucosaminyl deacetylase